MNKPRFAALGRRIAPVAVPLLGLALLVAAHRFHGWPGVALAAGAIVMWLLLHLTRTMQTLQRAASRPIGSVGSAVMLNARLQPGLRLVDVVARTRSLGALRSAEGVQPETWAWADASGCEVVADFDAGRLVRWRLDRHPRPHGLI